METKINKQGKKHTPLHSTLRNQFLHSEPHSCCYGRKAGPGEEGKMREGETEKVEVMEKDRREGGKSQ